MAKGSGKSSASSGTRKKHAKRAAGPAHPDELIPKEKKPKNKERGKKKEIRPKVYIAPVKPAPVQPDPLETTGLARTLPAELLVVLRSLGKKALVTKIRALEDLQADWVDKCKREGEDGSLVYILVEMLPVWLHHVSALFVHPSRRVRHLTAGLHASFLQLPLVRDQIFMCLREVGPPRQTENILGTWCMAAHDVDRAVSASALRSWNATISKNNGEDQLTLDEHLLPPLLAFSQRASLDPNGVYLSLNPIPPAVSEPPTRASSGRPTPVRKDDEQSLRAKIDESDESEQDRKARLRMGAFGAIRWVLENTALSPSDNLRAFFSNAALWTSLHHAEVCSFADTECFGHGQPIVRKAGWMLVQTLLRTWKGHLESLLPTLSSAILRSAWVDPDTTVHGIMWRPLLTFLKEFPNAWELAESVQALNKPEEDDEEHSGDEEEDAEIEQKDEETKAARGPSLAYQEFLQFLELGCSGSPMQGYPTVVIILSTIPSCVLLSSSSLPPLSDLFTSFWAAIDGRALSSLHRSATSAAFLSALLECIVFLVKRLRSDARNNEPLLTGSTSVVLDAKEEAEKLVTEQISRVWQELKGSTLKVEGRTAAKLTAQTLVSLDDIDEGLFRVAWATLSSAIRSGSDEHPSLVAVFLKIFRDQFKDGTALRKEADLLIAEISQSSVAKSELSLQSIDTPSADGVAQLVHILDELRAEAFDDMEFSARMDEMVTRYPYRLLVVSPSLLLAYLSHRNNQERCLQSWHALLSSVSSYPEALRASLTPLLDAAQNGILPKYLKPKADELGDLIGKCLVDALAPAGSAQLTLVRRILRTSDHFLSPNALSVLIKSVVSAFTVQVDHALRDSEGVSLHEFEPSLDLIASVFEYPPDTLPLRTTVDSLLPDLCLFAYLLPQCYPTDDDTAFVTARHVWEEWVKVSSGDSKDGVFKQVTEKLKVFLCDTQSRPLPEDILGMLSQGPPGLRVVLLRDIFPSPNEINDMLETLSPDAIDMSLAVVDSLIPPTSTLTRKTYALQTFDSRGFSPYARVVGALLQVLVEDRTVAKQNFWAVHHFLALSIYAQDFQSMPSAQSPAFELTALTVRLGDIITKVQQVVTYLLTSSGDDGWRVSALNAVMNDKSAEELGALPRFLVDTVKRSQRQDALRESRILRYVLQHILDEADKAEADLWITLARKIERKAPQTSMTIVSAIAEHAPDPPRLDRYRNELAADLLGIPASKADTEGLLTLRKLAASAPDPDSVVVFLPQPRAVNVVKACQQWISSDVDIDEEVESAMTLVFLHLAPILQNIPGAHWDLIFDVLESNLENSSITDDMTLVTLARTLRLIISIQDLAKTNKSFRAAWREREIPVLTTVRDLATARLDAVGVSVPRSVCRELVLTIVQDLPVSLIDQDTLPKMCHLIMDPSTEVQKMAYQLLRGAARKRTEYLVIEAGVDPEATIKADLPLELVDILQRNININEDGFEQEEQHVFGYLLGWMLIFDLFRDASLKVRLSYIDQLRNLDIIVAHFIPNVLGLLRLDRGLIKAFKLDIWAVDEFYVDHFEPGHSFIVPLLAAHLYYRALLTVPSLVHSWVLDCKDRNLSSSIVKYTSLYFSPVLIQAEIAHVKSPEATAALVDENLTIKVAPSVNEVIASYLVDEHQLEIKLKIPPDWPLHKIEIKDVKRVGVDENRWRAWILAVQQTIWSHNGRIIDGLGLFKKNVTLHFQGQVECAICYSIISVMDESLPRKPCKTCKNRFHAGCLYKWFNSSHSSSCPLCRSDIF